LLELVERIVQTTSYGSNYRAEHYILHKNDIVGWYLVTKFLINLITNSK